MSLDEENITAPQRHYRDIPVSHDIAVASLQ